MTPLQLHHFAVTAFVLICIATAVTYDLGMYASAVWNAFLAGAFAVLILWSFAIEHGLKLPRSPLKSRDS
jgi:hypothetical protein